MNKKECPQCKLLIPVTAFGRHVKAHDSEHPCKQCGNTVPGSKIFCTSSCAAKFNTNRAGTGMGRPKCLNCGMLTHAGKKYCSASCQWEYQYKKFIEDWKNGKRSGSNKNGIATSRYVYRFIKERDGEKCLICGGVEWMGKPMPLVLDHINGDSSDSRPENFRFICPNCDRFLPTFSGRNKGRGRKARKKYWTSG